LYSSAYYALRDTRTPLRFAVFRVALTTVLGYICAKPLPLWIGIDPRWGVAGLTASAGIAGWVEFALLRRGLHQRLGAGPSISGFVAKLWLAAALAVLVGSAGRLLPFAPHPILGAIATLGPFGVVYLVIGATFAPEERRLMTRLLRH
jgi:putative peptidoglycan lipid II flippase